MRQYRFVVGMRYPVGLVAVARSAAVIPSGDSCFFSKAFGRAQGMTGQVYDPIPGVSTEQSTRIRGKQVIFRDLQQTTTVRRSAKDNIDSND